MNLVLIYIKMMPGRSENVLSWKMDLSNVLLTDEAQCRIHWLLKARRMSSSIEQRLLEPEEQAVSVKHQLLKPRRYHSHAP